MTPAEEDALIHSACEPMQTVYDHKHREAIRIAIRAAVAQERERCANCCIDLSACVMPHAKDYFIECAAAIRRGE